MNEETVNFVDEMFKNIPRRPRAAHNSPDPVDTAFADGWEEAVRALRGEAVRLMKEKMSSYSPSEGPSTTLSPSDPSNN